MKLDKLCLVIDNLKSIYQCEDSVEVSLEANPDDIVGRVSDFVSPGVNRMSIGVQTFNEDDLEVFNRSHTVSQSLSVISECLKHLPRATSVDLLFGRPGQDLNNWLEELDTVIGMGLRHVSLYQLTVERGTPLFREVSAGRVKMPGERSPLPLTAWPLHLALTVCLSPFAVVLD